MIDTASVLLNAERIERIEARYQAKTDVYEAMDRIEALMVERAVSEDVINKIYSEVRASEAKCRYTGPHPRTFLEGFMSDKKFSKLKEAQAECSAVEDCGGITLANNRLYTLREGTKLHRSALGERSWVKDCSDELDEETVTAQAEAIGSMF
mmetsp:Transcript_17750/g.43403  ORF Transcript_17750/g.43403 Transcript_17750/m.43403 type:complete len:152 (-) Transcript_17750:263-718(-)